MKLSKIKRKSQKVFKLPNRLPWNHVNLHYQNEFIIKEHNVFLLSGPIEPFDINNNCSKDLNVGLITPCDTSLYKGFALFFKFSLIFMNMQMR